VKFESLSIFWHSTFALHVQIAAPALPDVFPGISSVFGGKEELFLIG
jgi:hypothetical protein